MEVPAPALALLALPWALLAAAASAWAATALLANRPATVPGKYSVELEGDFVVFIIGLHVDARHLPWRWRTAARAGAAMGAIQRELEAHPEYGCLLVRHTEALSNPTHLVQIWRSYDHLAAYARNRMGKHLGTWLAWDSQAKGFKDREIPGVGIFHEAYLVNAGCYEAIYRQMPRSGLAQIGKIVPASHGRMRSGKGRLGQTDGGDHSALGAAYAAAGDGDDSRKE